MEFPRGHATQSVRGWGKWVGGGRPLGVWGKDRHVGGSGALPVRRAQPRDAGLTPPSFVPQGLGNISGRESPFFPFETRVQRVTLHKGA